MENNNKILLGEMKKMTDEVKGVVTQVLTVVQEL
jgi:hypothetical protein